VVGDEIALHDVAYEAADAVDRLHLPAEEDAAPEDAADRDPALGRTVVAASARDALRQRRPAALVVAVHQRPIRTGVREVASRDHQWGVEAGQRCRARVAEPAVRVDDVRLELADQPAKEQHGHRIRERRLMVLRPAARDERQRPDLP
jgi:hypothetical protein